MLVETGQMMPITRLQKELAQTARDLSDSGNAVYILKNNIDLTGYYKIYFAKKSYRIVYRLVKNEQEIIEIWGIGKRDKMEIYRNIGKRILDRK